MKLGCRDEDIFISVWNLHRSPHHWEEADKFNPERWPLDGPSPNETNQNFRFGSSDAILTPKISYENENQNQEFSRLLGRRIQRLICHGISFPTDSLIP